MSAASDSFKGRAQGGSNALAISCLQTATWTSGHCLLLVEAANERLWALGCSSDARVARQPMGELHARLQLCCCSMAPHMQVQARCGQGSLAAAQGSWCAPQGAPAAHHLLMPLSILQSDCGPPPGRTSSSTDCCSAP